jgi:hypothetical protein
MSPHEHRPPAALEDCGRHIYWALVAYIVSVSTALVGVLA